MSSTLIENGSKNPRTKGSRIIKKQKI